MKSVSGMQTCFLSNTAGRGEYSSEMLNGLNRVNIRSPTGIAIPASIAIQEPGETDQELGNRMLVCIAVVKKRGCSKDTRG